MASPLPSPTPGVNPTVTSSVGNEQANGGGFEGASRLGREVAMWSPSMGSADSDLNDDKELLDARSRDMDRNDGLAHGGVQIHRDGIVGSHFKLNSKPDYKLLGLSEAWAEEFQEMAESKFTLFSESSDNWMDASRMNTLTSMVRLAIGVYTMGGEVLASAEWIREGRRPFNTAIQMIDVDRLSNPRGLGDTPTLRRGVEKNSRGAPIAYHIRVAHPGETFNTADNYRWKRVPVRKPWGRLQMIHILEQNRVDQTRGIGDMVSVLKEMRMTKKFKDVTLQSAVLAATYAATIESDLPPEQAFESLGVGGANTWAENYLTQIAEYTGNSKNLHIDGVRVPHMYPGTKLNIKNAGEPGGIGTGFEESLLRHTAAGLGLSYEQFSRDYTKTNYSSARASMGETWKFMQSRKKMVADRFASSIYSLWLEEAINKGELPVPKNAPNFYEGLSREAYSKCTWIGQGRGQIDELKETQAAILRIKSGLSTYEKECARFGDDYRETFEQKARENGIMKKLHIVTDLETNPASKGRPAAEAPADDPTDDQDDSNE